MTMLEIPAGIFTMGDEQEENNKPHQVTITRPFFMCDREVWMHLFQQFVDDPNYPATEKPQNWKWNEGPAPFVPTGDYPIQSVNWFDAVLFCNWLSKQEGRQGCYKRTGEKQKGKNNQNQDVE